MVLNGLGRYQESLEAAEQSLAVDPRKSHAWDSKGRVLQNLGRLEDALAAFDQALVLAPHNAETWFLKIAILRKLSRWEELITVAKQASAMNPVDARPWTDRGDAFPHWAAARKPSWLVTGRLPWMSGLAARGR